MHLPVHLECAHLASRIIPVRNEKIGTFDQRDGVLALRKGDERCELFQTSVKMRLMVQVDVAHKVWICRLPCHR